MKRIRRLVRRQAGYSLVELLVVMVVLGIVLTGLTTVFVQGSNAELNANRRFQAQLQATAAFDRLRRDVHCAGNANVNGGTITLSGCGPTQVSWCTVGSGTRYALYRTENASCGSTGKLYADYLISAAAFTYTPASQTSLATVHADIKVNVAPATTVDSFELVDNIALRNSLRA